MREFLPKWRCCFRQLGNLRAGVLEFVLKSTDVVSVIGLAPCPKVLFLGWVTAGLHAYFSALTDVEMAREYAWRGLILLFPAQSFRESNLM